ncbi:zinc finger CCCH domain-containing protein 36-like [Curcuma longa]|uniref:zinc finger CCCH domain-containing protein 36-like n=1 Tax=Curcuma longa TaxID=136217 RepID=UPI003D9DD9D7
MPEPWPKSDRAAPSLPLQVADSLADDCVPPGEDRREIGEEGERVADEERDEGRRCGEEVNDTSEKQEGCCKNPKSISSNSERSFVNSSNSYVQYFRDGDLGNGSPSKLHYKKTSENKNEELCQPNKRPWSSPFIQHERKNKNPAIVCDFFAQGWCIKGSSCRFLHKKEGVGNSSLEAQEGTSDMAISEYSTKPDLHLQRALVRTYGKDMRGLSPFKDDDILHASKNFSDEHFQLGSGRTSALLCDELRQKSMFQRKNTITEGLIPMVDFTADRYSTSGEISSRHFSNERMMYKEMPIGDHRNDASSLTENPLISESVLFSGGSSTPINAHRDSNDAYSFGEKPDDLSGQYQGSCFTIHPNFGNSTYSIRGSPATETLHSFAQTGTRFIHGPPVSDERGDVCTMLNHSSNFTTYGHPNVAGDSSSWLQQNLEDNTWENSIPFQPSFACASFIESCSDSQFDPLGSNIGHPKEVTTPVLAGDFKPEYDTNKSANSFTSASEGILCIKGAAHKYLSDTTTVAPGLTTNDENGNIPRMTDPAPINDAKVGNNMRDVNKVDDNIMESKSMKIVYAALVDFVKELLKPWWKEGRLSRDTHKLIVKKTTEKVLGALQPHQVPNSPVSLQQYLSSSRPKLLKLMEAYVDKYTKS